MRAGDTDLKAHYLNRILVNTDGSWPTTAVTENMRAYQINNQLESQFDTGSVSHTLLGGSITLGSRLTSPWAANVSGFAGATKLKYFKSLASSAAAGALPKPRCDKVIALRYPNRNCS